MRTQCLRIRLANSVRLTWDTSLMRPSFVFLNERAKKRFIVHAARDGIQEESGRCSIRDAMIERQAQNASVAHGQLPVAHDGTLCDSSDAENGGLRAIENGRESVNAMNAKIADGRGSTL